MFHALGSVAPGLIGAAAITCTIIWLIMPRGGGGRRPADHSHGNGGWILLAALVVAGVIGAANRDKIHQVAAKPPPPQVTKITNTVIKYVPAPAGHPLLSGWGLVAAIAIGGFILLGVVALIVHAVRSVAG